MKRWTHSQEVRLKLDGSGQVWQSRFGFSHRQEHRSPLVEGQVILRVSLWRGFWDNKVLCVNTEADWSRAEPQDENVSLQRDYKCVSLSVSACNLTHSRVVMGQSFSQLTRSQKFTAHLQVLLDLSLGCAQDPWNINRCLSVTGIIISGKRERAIISADHGAFCD